MKGVAPGGFDLALRQCGELRRAEPQGEAGMAWRLLWMRWAESDPEAALAASLRMDPEGEATAAVMLAAARRNPQSARAQLEEVRGAGKTRLLDGPQGAQFAAAVAREWWRQDKESAMVWVKGLSESVRGEAWSAVVSAAAIEDAAAASVMVAEMPTGRDRELASARVAEIWAGQSPMEAMAWVKTLSDDDRRRAGPQALIAWAEMDGAGAAGYLVGEGGFSVGDGGYKHAAPWGGTATGGGGGGGDVGEAGSGGGGAVGGAAGGGSVEVGGDGARVVALDGGGSRRSFGVAGCATCRARA